MKKSFSKLISALLIFILTLTMTLSSCGKSTGETDHADNQTAETIETSTTGVEDLEREAGGKVDDAEEPETTPETPEVKESETKSEQQLLEDLEEQYAAVRTYQDETISFRYLILGKSELVSTTIVGGIASTTAVPYAEIARNEQTEVGELSYLFFYDKNNQALQLICKTQTAKKILDKIQDLKEAENTEKQ